MDEQIRNAIKEEMEAQDLTQSALARKLNKPQQNINRAIGNNKSEVRGLIPKIIIDILDALDMELVARKKQ